MNRRRFLQSVAACAGALVLPKLPAAAVETGVWESRTLEFHQRMAGRMCWVGAHGPELWTAIADCEFVAGEDLAVGDVVTFDPDTGKAMKASAGVSDTRATFTWRG